MKKVIFINHRGVILPIIPIIIVAIAVLLLGGSFAALKIINKIQTKPGKEATQAAQVHFGDVFQSPTLSPPASQKTPEPTGPSTAKATTPISKQTPKPTPTPVARKPPTCLGINVNPSTSGQAPFYVDFAALGTAGSHPIKGFEWDFNGDGAPDTQIISATTSYRFHNPGNYQTRVQIHDTQGQTSNVCSVQITVSPPPTATITGYVFSDNNCNVNRDAGENGISGVTVEIKKLPEYSTVGSSISNAQGQYSVQISNPNGQYRPQSVAPSGYKSPPSYNPQSVSIFGSTTVQLDIPFVPASNISLCTIP